MSRYPSKFLPEQERADSSIAAIHDWQLAWLPWLNGCGGLFNYNHRANYRQPWFKKRTSQKKRGLSLDWPVSRTALTNHSSIYLAIGIQNFPFHGQPLLKKGASLIQVQITEIWTNVVVDWFLLWHPTNGPFLYEQARPTGITIQFYMTYLIKYRIVIDFVLIMSIKKQTKMHILLLNTLVMTNVAGLITISS